MQGSGDSLARQLSVFHANFLYRLARDERRIVQEAADEVSAQTRQQRTIHVGETAPDFTLPDQHNQPVRLSEQLTYGPVLLVFVRGSWCPFSALALRSYQHALAAVHDTGSSVLAITPEPPNRCSSMAERDLLAFPTLSDGGSDVALAYGVTYDIPQNLRSLYIKWGQDLPRLNTSGTWRVPLPATIVVGMDGRVTMIDVPPTVYERLEPASAISKLTSMRVAA